MEDADGVFEQFSDSLSFPSYFGWNWAALSECLRDLQWLPAHHYLIVIDDAPRILSAWPEERMELFRILVRASRHWATAPGIQVLGRRPSFGVLLLCDERDVVSFKMEFSAFLR
ncbi:barstar family protein [Micromonospora echinospora]